jgi:hypothetical protein
VKLSIIIAANNEAGSIAETLTTAVEVLEGAEIEHEILVTDDVSVDHTEAVVRDIATEHPQISCLRSHYPRGFGFAVRSGLDSYTGDAAVPDDGGRLRFPRRPPSLPRAARARLRLRPRFPVHARVGGRGLPADEADPQPARQLVHPAPVPSRVQRHHERVQGIPPRGHRHGPAPAL